MYSARAVNVFLGAWLIFSLWVWPHSLAITINYVAVGLLVGIVAMAGSAFEKAHYANAILGAWLVASAWLLGGAARADTFINTLLVGFGILVVALIPNELPSHWFDEGWPVRGRHAHVPARIRR